MIPTVETPHALAADEVCARLSADADRGLSAHEAEARLREAGPNRLRQQKPRSIAQILGHQLKSVIIWLLAAAVVFSFVIGDMVEAAAILLVLVLNTAIGFWTEYRAARSMEALIHFGEVRTRVRRDGSDRMIDARDVVPGDLVVLEAGDVVTADLRLIEAAGLTCDESVLTGESGAVTKSTHPLDGKPALGDRVNMAFKGTAVTRGTGLGVVVATGMATELGHITGLALEAESGVSPLEVRLEQLGRRLIWLTLVLAGAMIAAGIARGRDIGTMIQTGVALAVAAIPEGLPVVATLTLARGMWRMARRNALITRLSSVETLGATTLILTDKTGTLTENRMSVERYLLADGDQPFPFEGPAGTTLDLALRIGALCTSAELDGDGEKGAGDPMELALLRAAREARVDVADPDPTTQHAFDPTHRMMATVHAVDAGYLFAVKGAPEALLPLCTRAAGADGPSRLTAEDREEWVERASRAAQAGFRNLALATKTTGSGSDEPYEDLTLVGIACLSDPLRAEIPGAIEACRSAGIDVIMVTGDHADTAARIAADAGIAAADAPVLGGDELDGLDPATAADESRDLLRRTHVFARIAPTTKLSLVAFYQDEGQVVAMTGDGVNDAPALKKADIGIAMGRRGTQVAQEAAHMVLRDDDFTTIIEAVRQGRIIFANIRKFVVYLMSCNLSEVAIVGLAVAIGLPTPLLPLQILFLNLVTDVFPAFALGLGKGDGREMQRPPRDPDEAIMAGPQWWRVGLLGLSLTLATLGAFGFALFGLDVPAPAAVTVAFLTLAAGQLWNVFNVRATDTTAWRNDIVANPYVWGALALCLALVGGAVSIPLLSDVLRLPFPGWTGLLCAGAFSIVPLIIGQAAIALDRGREG
ncbi:MAG: cation-translocating P-type ATPase [Maritimibacter harenae]